MFCTLSALLRVDMCLVTIIIIIIIVIIMGVFQITYTPHFNKESTSQTSVKWIFAYIYTMTFNMASDWDDFQISNPYDESHLVVSSLIKSESPPPYIFTNRMRLLMLTSDDNRCVFFFFCNTTVDYINIPGHKRSHPLT